MALFGHCSENKKYPIKALKVKEQHFMTVNFFTVLNKNVNT